MKKSYFLGLIIVISVSFIAVSCGGRRGLGGTLEGETTSATTEGWKDKNTFHIIGMGAAPTSETDPFVRKAMAKEAAVIDAQVKVIEKFVGAKVQGASGVQNFRLTGFAAAKEVEGAIKGGSVKKVTWDKNTQDCEVLYEVKARGLQRKVKNVTVDNLQK
jgi:hypothetical protein